MTSGQGQLVPNEAWLGASFRPQADAASAAWLIDSDADGKRRASKQPLAIGRKWPNAAPH